MEYKPFKQIIQMAIKNFISFFVNYLHPIRLFGYLLFIVALFGVFGFCVIATFLLSGVWYIILLSVFGMLAITIFVIFLFIAAYTFIN